MEERNIHNLINSVPRVLNLITNCTFDWSHTEMVGDPPSLLIEALKSHPSVYPEIYHLTTFKNWCVVYVFVGNIPGLYFSRDALINIQKT